MWGEFLLSPIPFIRALLSDGSCRSFYTGDLPGSCPCGADEITPPGTGIKPVLRSTPKVKGYFLFYSLGRILFMVSYFIVYGDIVGYSCL